jgi:hypothetical protein
MLKLIIALPSTLDAAGTPSGRRPAPLSRDRRGSWRGSNVVGSL